MYLSVQDFFYNLYTDVLAQPLIIKVCIFFIFSGILIAIIAFSSVSIIRYRYNKKEEERSKLIPKIDNYFNDLYLKNIGFENVDIKQDIAVSIGKLTNKKLDLIVERLILFKHNFKLENEGVLRVMEALNLDNHLIDKLGFSTTKRKIRGFKELANLAVSAHDSELLPFTYSKNKEIRSEARSAYLKLSKNDPFKFFDEANEYLTQWDQIVLLAHIKTIENLAIPNFSKWISYSSNASVISFCLKMCAYFNQTESISSIITFLSTPNHLLRAEAIETLGDLHAREAEPMMKYLYQNQPTVCQVAILRTLGKLKTGKSLDFLAAEFSHGSNVDLRKNAANSIITHGEKGIEMIASLKENTDEYGKLILTHIENPLIMLK